MAKKAEKTGLVVNSHFFSIYRLEFTSELCFQIGGEAFERWKKEANKSKNLEELRNIFKETKIPEVRQCIFGILMNSYRTTDSLITLYGIAINVSERHAEICLQALQENPVSFEEWEKVLSRTTRYPALVKNVRKNLAKTANTKEHFLTLLRNGFKNLDENIMIGVGFTALIEDPKKIGELPRLYTLLEKSRCRKLQRMVRGKISSIQDIDTWLQLVEAYTNAIETIMEIPVIKKVTERIIRRAEDYYQLHILYWYFSHSKVTFNRGNQTFKAELEKKITSPNLEIPDTKTRLKTLKKLSELTLEFPRHTFGLGREMIMFKIEMEAFASTTNLRELTAVASQQYFPHYCFGNIEEERYKTTESLFRERVQNSDLKEILRLTKVQAFRNLQGNITFDIQSAVYCAGLEKVERQSVLDSLVQDMPIQMREHLNTQIIKTLIALSKK